MNILHETSYWVRWVTKKVASRDRLYVPRRLSYWVRKKVVDAAFSTVRHCESSPFSGAVPTDKQELLQYFRNRSAPRFHFQASDIPHICSLVPPEYKRRTIEMAEQIVQRAFRFRGSQPIRLDVVDWNTTPVGSGLGWRWDLNRQFYLTQLGFAYWYTEEASFLRAFVELSTSWIQQHIWRLGKIRWDTPFEVGARLNAWLWAYFLFLHGEQWDAGSHYRFLVALGSLAEYLYQVMEYHNLGNHLLLESKALIQVGELFPEFRCARKWRAKGWHYLIREVKAQVCKDGVHGERSTMYHRIVAGELAEFMLLCHRNQNPHTTEVSETVTRMAQFESWISTDDSTAPLTGDAYASDVYLRFSAPMIVSGVSDASADIRADGSRYEQTMWALGRRCPPIVASAEQQYVGGKAFPAGGFYVSRNRGRSRPSVLVWDCGPFGYPLNPLHGHADALSLTLTVEGVPLLIDPGTSERDMQVRERLRGTRSHNTVVVDGENQSVLARRSDVWYPAEARLRLWGSLAECDVMVGSHNGYSRLPEPVVHIRTVIAVRDAYWLVIDCISGVGRHQAEQRFHTRPGAIHKWLLPQQQLRVTWGETSLLLLPVQFSANMPTSQRVEIAESVAEMVYGKLESITVVNTVVSGRTPLYMGMLLVPETYEGAASVRVRSLQSLPDINAIEVCGTGFRDRLYVSLGGTDITVPDIGKTDATVLIIRETASTHTTIFAAGATTMVCNDTDLLRNSSPAPLLRLEIPRQTTLEEAARGSSYVI